MDADYILQELCWGGNDIARPFIKRINDYILNDQNVGQYALAFLLSPDGHFTAKSILKGCYEYPDPQKNTYKKKNTSRKLLLNMWWILILMRNNIRFSNHELDDLLDKENVILENFDESDSEEPLQKNTRIVKRGGEKKVWKMKHKCILGWWFFAFKSCIDLIEANLIFSTGKFGNASIHVSNKIFDYIKKKKGSTLMKQHSTFRPKIYSRTSTAKPVSFLYTFSFMSAMTKFFMTHETIKNC